MNLCVQLKPHTGLAAAWIPRVDQLQPSDGIGYYCLADFYGIG